MSSVAPAIGKSVQQSHAPRDAARWWPAASSLVSGRAVDAACRWAAIILLVRVCDLSEFGQWALAVAIVTPAITLLDLRMRWLIAADGVPGASLTELIACRVLTLLIAGCIVFALLASAPTGVEPRFLQLLLLIWLLKTVELISESLRGVCQRFHRVHRVAIGSGLGGLAMLAGTAVGIVVEPTAIAAVTGMMAGRTLVLLLWELPAAYGATPVGNRKWRFGGWHRAIAWGVPLSAGALIVGLGRGIPRYGLAYWYDAESVGVFTALATVVAAGDIFVSSIVNATIGSLGQSAREAPRLFRRTLRQLTALVAGVGVVGTILSFTIGSRLLAIVYGQPYQQYGPLLGCLALAMSFAYLNGILQAGLVACRKARRIPLYITASACVAAVTAVIAIPLWHLYGAALTLFAMTSTTTVLLASALMKSDVLAGTAKQERGLLRVVLGVSSTAASYEIWTRLQARHRSVTVVSFFGPRGVALLDGVTHVFGSGRILPFIGTLARSMRTGRYAAVHLHAPHLGPLAALAALCALRPSLLSKTVYHIHSSWKLYSVRNRVLCVTTMLLSRRVVICSRAAWQALPAVLRKTFQNRIVVIPNGVEVERVASCRPEHCRPTTHRPLDLVCVATLRPIKNVEATLRALRCLPSTACRLTVIGDGPDRESLERLTRRWHLTDRVVFAGRLSRDEVYARLWQADAMITTSRGEGLPLAVLEALASCTLVIASDIPPHREVDPAGEFIEFVGGDCDQAIADAIRRVVQLNPSAREARARRGLRACVDRFSANTAIAAMDAVYDSLSASGSPASRPLEAGREEVAEQAVGRVASRKAG